MSVLKKTLAVLAVASAVTAPAVMPAQARQASEDDAWSLSATDIAALVGGLALLVFVLSDGSDSN